MKYDTLNRLIRQARGFQQVPGDSLTFAVRVSGQVNLGGRFRRLLDLANYLFAAFYINICGFERVFYVDTQVA